MRSSCALLGALLVSSATSLTAATYLVEPDGSGDHPTIQAAVAAASSGDIIELGDGTFTGDGNRDVNLMGKALTIRSRSGSIGASTIDCQGSEFDPHRAFLVVPGEGPRTILEGLTIQNGYALHGGGAVLASGTELEIVECEFVSNHTKGDSVEVAGLGGAILLRDCTGTSVIDCRFADNESRTGGAAVGIYDSHSVEFQDCSFLRNRSYHEDWHGGAIRVFDSQNLSVESCRFERNWCFYAAGGLSLVRASADVSDCEFLSNHAEGENHGGGSGLAALRSEISINRCNFEGNSTEWVGAGVAIVECQTSLASCTFKDNRATRGGTAFFNYGESVSTLRDCTFIGNQGRTTIWNSNSSVLDLERCTVAYNSATDGAVVYGWNASTSMHSTLIAYNSAAAFWTGDEPFHEDFHCSDVFGNPDGDWDSASGDWASVNLNFSLDPRFCNPGDERLYVASNSPCAPDNNPQCGRVGAWGVSCSSAPDQVPATWGGVKEEFRDTQRPGRSRIGFVATDPPGR